MTETEQFKEINKIMEKMKGNGFDVIMDIQSPKPTDPFEPAPSYIYRFDYEYYLGPSLISVQGSYFPSMLEAFVHCIKGYKRYKNYREYRAILTKE